MFCLNCGREAKEGQPFCGNCGSKLPVDSYPTSTASTAGSTPPRNCHVSLSDRASVHTCHSNLFFGIRPSL